MKRALLAALLLAALPARAEGPPPPGYAPEQASDEAGLWMRVDKLENDIRTAPNLVRDEKLNAYVKGVLCRLTPAYCGSLRVYIAEVPAFNAYALPNGAIVVWSGLLLRTENEAQLAFVLGHEMTHYLHRHSLEAFRDASTASGALVALRLATAGIGYGLVGGAATLAADGALSAHTRAQERDADNGGFSAATAAGYDPRQGAAIWRFVGDEDKASVRPGRSIFFASHPPPEERLATLDARDAKAAASQQDWIVNQAVYRAAIAPFAESWVADELARGAPGESVVLFQRLAARDPGRGLFQFALGEAYRRRGAKDDMAPARAAFQAATASTDAPLAAWRGLGLLAMKDGDKAAARAAFTQYRARAPKADDAAMIDYYLAQL